MSAGVRAASCGAAAAALTALLPAVSAPPVLAPATLADWIERVGPIRAVAGAGWLLATALCAYLLTLSLLAGAARATRLPGLVRASLACTPRALHQLVGVGVGVGLTVATVTPAAAGAPTPPPRQVLVDQGSAEAPTTTEVSEAPTMQVVIDDPAETPAEPVGTPVAPAPADTWTIAVGDHLWGISAAVLADHLGHPADDAAVAAYLHRLVEANAGTLAVPGQPDLVFPGQVFALPTP